MLRTILTLSVFSLVLPAQTAETRVFRAIMSPANEVPPIAGLDAAGSSTLTAHVMRDAQGRIVSGTVEFQVYYRFPSQVTFTGLHIHSGPAGVNAPVTINSGLTGQVPSAATGRGVLTFQGQVLPDNTNGIATLEGMFTDPSQYYANLHTTVNTGGAIRGQLQRAEVNVTMGLMSTANEVPAVDLNASAVGAATTYVTRDSGGSITSAEVVFDVAYNFPAATTFTGLHVHNGLAGVNGGVTLNSGMTTLESEPNGRGTIHLRNEIDLATAGALVALDGLLYSPQNHYINLHTTDFRGGAVRDQLRSTDRMTMTMAMSPANEIPTVTLNAQGVAVVDIHTLRSATGAMQAAYVRFDVNHRFPGETDFTGLHIHDGTAAENGAVRINTGLGTPPLRTTTGFGSIDITVVTADAAALATVTSLVANPENHYINLHTTEFRGGAVRAQMAPGSAVRPVVSNVISSVSDPSLRTAALGGLMTVFGRDLFKMPGSLAGFPAGALAPTSLHGTSATIGGQAARILMLGRMSGNNPPDYIVLQVPFEAAAGAGQLVVTNSAGAGQPFALTVAATAPALFFDSTGGIALHQDQTLVRPDNPARAGEMIFLYSTGLGQTSPALASGAAGTLTPFQVVGVPVTATIGGAAATVVGAAAFPGVIGVYGVLVTVPAGLPAGNAAARITAGGASSNTVMIQVR